MKNRRAHPSRCARQLRNASIVTGTLLLAACGGSGGRVESPGSNPVPTPSPVPTPAPTPTPADPARSVEYRASGGAAGAKAGAAYDASVTGKGVTIAVIDSGIDLDNSEFAGRISPDSKSFDTLIARCMNCSPETVHFDLDDVQGHGTASASVVAGRRTAAVATASPTTRRSWR